MNEWRIRSPFASLFFILESYKSPKTQKKRSKKSGEIANNENVLSLSAASINNDHDEDDNSNEKEPILSINNDNNNNNNNQYVITSNVDLSIDALVTKKRRPLDVQLREVLQLKIIYYYFCRLISYLIYRSIYPWLFAWLIFCLFVLSPSLPIEGQ